MTRRSQRGVAVAVVLLALLVVLAAVAMVGGAYETSWRDVTDVISGGGDSAERLIVLDFRAPRLVAAALVGGALGLAGLVFQSLSRNPLGSPDILGFTTGSATGALVVLVLVGIGASSPVVGAWVGGLGALLVIVFLTGSAPLSSERTILAGIALAAMLGSVNDYLITRAPLEVAQQAKTWLFGSLAVTTWADVAVLAVSVVVLSIVLASHLRGLRLLEHGDDLATGLGVRVPRTRLVLVLVGVGLTGSAIAVAGPIGFLALAAPQVARRLVRSSAGPAGATFLTGAVLLLAADVVAQRALAPFQIPVGLVTGALGGAYLVALLLWAPRRS